jgi:hypothetical protein
MFASFLYSSWLLLYLIMASQIASCIVNLEKGFFIADFDSALSLSVGNGEAMYMFINPRLASI